MKLLIAITLSLIAQSALAGKAKLDSFILPIAKKKPCVEISYEGLDDFNGYAYGYFENSGRNSAVFWCKATEGKERDFFMMLWFTESYALDCPSVVRYWNYPGETTISHNLSLPLSDFIRATEPHEEGPKDETTKGPVITEEYDGTGAHFYCYKGDWYLSGFH